jgi:hypothetical protein
MLQAHVELVRNRPAGLSITHISFR